VTFPKFSDRDILISVGISCVPILHLIVNVGENGLFD